MLEIGPFERNRPGRPGGANIGKGLLDADRPLRAVHDEDQIEIAVAHFTDPPIVRPGPKKRAPLVEAGEQRDQTRRVQCAIGGTFRCFRHDRLPFAASGRVPPKIRPESVESCFPYVRNLSSTGRISISSRMRTSPNASAAQYCAARFSTSPASARAAGRSAPTAMTP